MSNPLQFNPDAHSQYREWQCPPSAAPDHKIVGWANESTEEGLAWLKSQRGQLDFRKALDVISGADTASPRQQSSDYRSKVSANPLKRNLREVIATLAKLRPVWGYHTSNAAYKNQADMMNKILRSLFLEQFFDRSISDALAYAAATARGWINPVYSRDMYGTGHGAIQLDAYGAPCVLPNQLPANGNFQNAYAVTILKELPIAMAHGMFPQHQAVLKPTESRYWYMNDGVRAAAKGNLWQRMAGRFFRAPGSEACAELLIPIRYTYVIDLAINTTDKPITMGEPGSSWSYTVPALKQDIPMGLDPRSGTMTFRKADENDARLYPYRRLIISDMQTKLYDGPSFDWHGMLPLASFCFDAWPWEPLGFSLVHEGYELNEAIKTIDRGNMDKCVSQLDMSLAYDTNAISEKEARTLDPMMPRGRYGYDGNATEPGKPPFTPIVPESIIKIDPTSLQLRDMFKASMDEQLAIRDVMALAKLRAVGSMDDIEKIVEANGPIIEGMSRSMERPMRDIGNMVKYLILQYMPVTTIMQYIGAFSTALEVMDYDPTSLIPSHIPGESPDQPSALNRIQRARIFANNLKFEIMPNTLHEMSQITMKLGLIQLKKAGVKICSQTIAEAWNISNYGEFEGATELERFRSEQEEDIETAARMQAIGAAAGLGQPPGAPGPGGKKPEGRPSTDAKPGKIQSKDGGARSTISTSG
jgi:hypothetical protein